MSSSFLLTTTCLSWFVGGCRQEDLHKSTRTPEHTVQPFTAPVTDTRLQALRSAVAEAPNDLSRRWDLTHALREAGRTREAAQQLSEISRRAPDSETTLSAVGRAYFDLRLFADAEHVFHTLTQRWRNRADGWEGLAGALYFQRRYLDAIEAARQCVKLAPNETKYRGLLATALMEHALSSPGAPVYVDELREARRELQGLAGSAADKGDYSLRLGRVSLSLGDSADAVRSLEYARRLNPVRMDVLYALLQAYRSDGKVLYARRIVEDGLNQRPDDAVLLDARGQLILAEDEPNANERAAKAFQAAVRLDPSRPQYHERLGAALIRQNRLSEAKEALLRSIALDSHRTFANQQLATLYLRQGDRVRSAEYAAKANAISRSETTLRHLQNLASDHPADISLHFRLADAYLALDHRSAALEEYRLIQRRDPKNARARSAIATLPDTSLAAPRE